MNLPGDGLHDLPSELVCSIFRLTVGLASARQDRCRLMLVCRQWREYVEGSALLWTSIAASHGPTYVRRALEKSKGATIDIDCQLSKRPAKDLKAFLIEAGQHIARWRSLKLGVPRSTPPWEIALAPLTTAPAPSLEALHVVIRSAHLISEDPITLFGGAPAPSPLRHVTFHGIPVAFEPLGLSGLVSLNLEVPTISTPQLFEILRGSPGLEKLSLVDNPGVVAIESQASNLQPIELPKLVSLSLIGMGHGGANHLLSNIRIPNYRRVTISTRIERVNARAVLFTPSTAHLLHEAIPVSDDPAPVIILEEVDRNHFEIRFRGIELKLYVDGERRIQEILGWLADGLGSGAAECPFHLILDRTEWASAWSTELPPPFAVKHFSISYRSVRSEALYAAMAQPPVSTSSGWLLPQMESLSVELLGVESQKKLVSMLRGRYAGGTSTGETESTYGPVNLRAVELRGLPRTEGLVEKIRRILGEVNVFWAGG